MAYAIANFSMASRIQGLDVYCILKRAASQRLQKVGSSALAYHMYICNISSLPHLLPARYPFTIDLLSKHPCDFLLPCARRALCVAWYHDSRTWSAWRDNSPLIHRHRGNPVHRYHTLGCSSPTISSCLRPRRPRVRRGCRSESDDPELLLQLGEGNRQNASS
jgi:hypothetical protein